MTSEKRWKILQKSPLFFIKFVQNKDEYIVSVTNYKSIWASCLSSKKFISILKENNEDLSFDNEEDWLNKGVDILLNPEKNKKVVISDKDINTLIIKLTKSYGYPLYLNLELSLKSNDHIFKEIIQPLLKTVSDLRSSQSQLRRELIKKDKEIEEYKCEGGKIALRHLKTIAYNDEIHMSKHTNYINYFGDNDVPEVLLNTIEDYDESTKVSTTEVQTITSGKRKKTNAQRCREYREKKKLQNTMAQNVTAKRSDECSETDQLPTKKPKTNAERRKKHYEVQKLKKQIIKKIPKSDKQRSKEYYYRKKKLQALNTLNHYSDAPTVSVKSETCISQEIQNTNCQQIKKENSRLKTEIKTEPSSENNIITGNEIGNINITATREVNHTTGQQNNQQATEIKNEPSSLQIKIENIMSKTEIKTEPSIQNDIITGNEISNLNADIKQETESQSITPKKRRRRDLKF